MVEEHEKIFFSRFSNGRSDEYFVCGHHQIIKIRQRHSNEVPGCKACSKKHKINGVHFLHIKMCSAQTCDGKENKDCNLKIATAHPSDIRVAPECNRSDEVSTVFGD